MNKHIVNTLIFFIVSAVFNTTLIAGDCSEYNFPDLSFRVGLLEESQSNEIPLDQKERNKIAAKKSRARQKRLIADLTCKAAMLEQIMQAGVLPTEFNKESAESSLLLPKTNPLSEDYEPNLDYIQSSLYMPCSAAPSVPSTEDPDTVLAKRKRRSEAAQTAKRIQNRIYAREVRARKKKQLEDLKSKVVMLEKERLTNEAIIEKLTQENEHLKNLIKSPL